MKRKEKKGCAKAKGQRTKEEDNAFFRVWLLDAQMLKHVAEHTGAGKEPCIEMDLYSISVSLYAYTQSLSLSCVHIHQ